MALTTLYYKSKYYPIGANPDKGSTRDSDAKKIGDIAEKQIGADLNDMLKKQEQYLGTVLEGLNGYSTGLNKTIAMQQSFAAELMKGVKAATMFEEVEIEAGKALKIGTAEVLGRRDAYKTMQANLKFTNDQLDRFMEITQAVTPLHGKLMKTMADSGTDGQKNFIEAQMAAQGILQKNTQLSEEQQADLIAYSAASGTSLANQVLVWEKISEGMKDSIDKETTFQIIAEGIAGAGADIRSQFSKIPGNLEMAVLKSKKLGMSLDQINQTGEGLLDIESSVNKELAYQQLSGKRLVKDGKSLTNAYREAFLSGDADKMLDVQKDILETQDDVLKGTDYYAKKALADALGMDYKQLMTIYEKKKATEQLNAVAAQGGSKLKEMVGNLENIKLTPEKMAEIEQQLKVDFAGDENAKNLQDATNALKSMYEKQGATETPADRIERLLTSTIQNNAINVIAKREGGVNEFIKQSKADAEKMGITAYDKSPILNFSTELTSIAETFGKMQQKQVLVTANTALSQKIVESVPILGAAIGDFKSTVDNFVTKYNTGKGAADMTKGSVKSNDSIMQINDGIAMSFNENDKMTIVAGPYGSINDKTADKLVNNETAKMMGANKSADTTALLQSIANGFNMLANKPASNTDTKSIVQAIQEGLSRVSITVKLDPMAIHKEIEFNIG